MTNTDNCQQIANNESDQLSFVDRRLADLDELLVGLQVEALTSAVAPNGNDATSPKRDMSALLAAAKAVVEKTKEENGYYEKAETNAAIDAYRKDQGRIDRNNFERGQYASRKMREQGKPVNSYGVPEGPEKAQKRREKRTEAQRRRREGRPPEKVIEDRQNNNAYKANERALRVQNLSAEELAAYNASEAQKKAKLRSRKKNSEKLEAQRAQQEHYADDALFGKF